MKTATKNTLVLSILTALLGGAGLLLLYVYYPGRIARWSDRQADVRVDREEVRELEARMQEVRDRVDRFRSLYQDRYKVVPESLRTAGVLSYLNDRTAHGFYEIKLSYDRSAGGGDPGFHRVVVSGLAPFTRLYDLVWRLEQDRQLYRIERLEVERTNVMRTDSKTDGEYRVVAVRFRMPVKAYFSRRGRNVDPAEVDRVVLPADYLPARGPAVNPFYPVLMRELPPNTYDRVKVDEAALHSIAGDVAVFQEGGETHRVREGERVYLGRLTRVDPSRGEVEIRLNKGGIVEEKVMTVRQSEFVR